MASRRGRGRGSNNNNNVNNPEFLWVNRTPESERLSATRQERDEVRTITTHARQWRAALRRQQRLYTAQTEATRAQSIVGWGMQNRAGNLSETSSGETSGAPSPAAMAQITGNSTNPFSYLETPEDAWWSHNAFQFAVESWLPSVFQDLDVLDETLSSSESTVATIQRIIQGCLSNRMHMFSVLAASSGFLKYILRLQLDRHDSPEYCMGKALQYLRYHLASEPEANENLIFDLKALSTFERYVENFEGARTHLRMVQHLVESLGGLDILDAPLRLMCWLWDLLVAGGTGETPLMPLTWDPGLLPQEQMRREILPDLAQSGVVPSGTALLEHVTRGHLDISTIIVDMVQWFQVQQLNQIHNFRTSSTERWARTRSFALVHRLLSLSPSSSSMQSPREQSGRENAMRVLLSECLRQSFLIVISDMEVERRSRTDVPPSLRDATSSMPWSNAGLLRQSLNALLQARGETEDSDSEHAHQPEREEELVLWMACLGTQAATEPRDSDWFLELAKHLAAKRRITSMDDVVQLMGRYLHRCERTGTPSVVDLEGLVA